MMIKKYLFPFRYSIILLVIVLLSLIVSYRTILFTKTAFYFSQLDITLFILSGLACYIASLSFFFPFMVYNKRMPFWEKLKKTMKYVYIDSVGGNASSFAESEFKTGPNDIKKIKFADMTGIVLMSIILLFLISLFYVEIMLYFIILETVFLFIMILEQKPILDKGFLFLILLSIFRYLFEFPRTLFTFLSAGLTFSLPLVYLLLVTSSMLYFVPKFRGAGGLLAFYMVVLFYLLGMDPIQGFFVVILFRLNGILFFSIPIYLTKKVMGF